MDVAGPLPRSRRIRLVAAAGVGLMLLAAALTGMRVIRSPGVPRLYAAGIAENPCSPQKVIVVPANSSATYVPDSNVLSTQAGSACASAAIQADRSWLQSGLIPGSTAPLKSMAARALLNLHVSVQPDGAVIAGWKTGWNYSWPRDSSWVAVALAATGHGADAYAILRFLQRTQQQDGWWAARYSPAGTPVDNGRRPSLTRTAGYRGRSGPGVPP